jgi:hypothetical protein
MITRKNNPMSTLGAATTLTSAAANNPDTSRGSKRQTAANYAGQSAQHQQPPANVERRHRTVGQSDNEEVDENERDDDVDDPGIQKLIAGS